MKKKILITLIAVCTMLFAFGAMNATAASSGTCGDNLTWSYDSETGELVISGEGEMYNWGSFNGSPWIKYRNEIKKVVIYDGVTSIGAYAFYTLTLENISITIPESVTSVGDYAFAESGGWSHVLLVLPNGITSIGNGAFSMTRLLTVVIPPSVTTIEESVFENSTEIVIGCEKGSVAETYAINNGIDYVNLNFTPYSGECGDDLIWTLDSGVLTISGEGAMPDCSSTSKPEWDGLKSSIFSVVIEDGVTNVGAYSFNDCPKVTSLSIGKDVTDIGDYAFYHCSRLSCLNIPDNVISIGKNAFYNCDSLLYVTMGTGVTSIEEGAFYSCEYVEELHIKDLVSWCNISFVDATSNPCAYFASIYVNGVRKSTITIPESVTEVKPFTFKCFYVDSIEFHSNVTRIEEGAFLGSNISELEIPTGVTYIGNNAFESCDNLTSVSIPDSVISIGDYAFATSSWDGSLKGVNIGSGVTSIGNYAFEGQDQLTKITIPDNVTSIGTSAFEKTTTISCNSTSYAYTWATENGYTVELLDVDDTVYYTISYNANGGENAPASQQKEQYVAMTLTTDIPTRYGFEFLGWATTADATTAKYQPGGTFVANADTTLYAVWKNISVTISLGEKAFSSNLRYYETDGNQYLIENDDNTFTVIPEKDMLIEIVEKENADSSFTVSTKYYLVDYETLTYTELNLDSFNGNTGNPSIRVKDPVGMRFMSSIITLAKNEEVDFVIEEYGFIVALQSQLDATNAQLNFDFSKYVKGVAYNKADGTDIVFDSTNDESVVFSGVLYNIPETQYKAVLTSKTYTKINVNGVTYTVYGEPVSASMYEIAKLLINTEGITGEMKSALLKIIIKCENELYLELDSLFD